MQTFFGYFGSKYRLAESYGPPQREIVIEPFAGGAGYSCYWDVKKAILIEKSEPVYRIWDYLINKATPEEIMALDASCVSILEPPACNYPQAIKDLMSFNMGFSTASSRNVIPKPALEKKENGSSRIWGEALKVKIVEQLPLIKDWEVYNTSYEFAPDLDAHYHIDPPYYFQGTPYKCNNKQMDWKKFGKWVLDLEQKGYVGEVCEAASPTGQYPPYLPFKPFRDCLNQKNGTYTELIYHIGTPPNEETIDSFFV